MKPYRGQHRQPADSWNGRLSQVSLSSAINCWAPARYAGPPHTVAETRRKQVKDNGGVYGKVKQHGYRSAVSLSQAGRHFTGLAESADRGRARRRTWLMPIFAQPLLGSPGLSFNVVNGPRQLTGASRARGWCVRQESLARYFPSQVGQHHPGTLAQFDALPALLPDVLLGYVLQQAARDRDPGLEVT